MTESAHSVCTAQAGVITKHERRRCPAVRPDCTGGRCPNHAVRPVECIDGVTRWCCEHCAADVEAGRWIDFRTEHIGFVFSDGGRAEAGYRGTAGDCVTRAITIATRKPYREVYDALNQLAKRERRGKRKRGVSSACDGVYRSTYQRYLEGLGWRWMPTMRVGQGCTVHLRADELPRGPLIVRLSGHTTAVLDGVIYDTDDPSRHGTRCVYGYFVEPGR